MKTHAVSCTLRSGLHGHTKTCISMNSSTPINKRLNRKMIKKEKRFRNECIFLKKSWSEDKQLDDSFGGISVSWTVETSVDCAIRSLYGAQIPFN